MILLLKHGLDKFGIIRNICVIDKNNEKKIIIFYYTITLENCIHSVLENINECEINYNSLDLYIPSDKIAQCLLIYVNAKKYICQVPTGCISD